MNLAPPALQRDTQPEFRDTRGCAEWLQFLPLADVGSSHERLLARLESLNALEIAPAERLKMLELVREPIVFVQGEHAKKFRAKAVPLARTEREAFDAVLALWDALACGWELCLQALAAGTREGGRSSAALICQRALWSAGRKIAEHFPTYQGVPERDWRRLHRAFACAEQRGVAGLEVAHPARPDTHTTCAQSYAQLLLLELANPNEQTARQQAIVAGWLETWARKLSIASTPTAPSGVAPLSVDLDSGAGASRAGKEGHGVRFVHVDEAGKSIRKRIGLLRGGASPESLGLGTEVSSGVAAQHLAMLHRRWCEERGEREHPRRPVNRAAQLSTGLAAMHYHLTGQPFRQPGESVELGSRERDEIATFGRVSMRDAERQSAAHAAALEPWDICDESLSGFRLQRASDAGASRFVHHQLLAVRPGDASSFILCTVRWLSVSESGLLRMGTRIVPGVARGIAVRATGINAGADKYVPALALPAVPALRSPATLVLPLGWYRAGKVLDAHTETSERLMLGSLLERGADFERCAFEPA